MLGPKQDTEPFAADIFIQIFPNKNYFDLIEMKCVPFTVRR